MDALAPATGMNILTKAARVAARVLAVSPTDQRDAALRAAANALRAQTAEILEANARDVAASQANAAFRDRLTLDPARVEAMAKGLEEIAELPDPLGRVLSEWTRPNGLLIRRVAVPIGVIGMIYESRPNVGADAAGLCIKSGNAVILRGGSESFHSARAIQKAIEEGLRAVHLPEACVQIVPDTDRAYVGAMLDAAGMIDLIIPRGGKSLVERVQRKRAFRCLPTRRVFATLISMHERTRIWPVRFWQMPRCAEQGFVGRRKRFLSMRQSLRVCCRP